MHPTYSSGGWGGSLITGLIQTHENDTFGLKNIVKCVCSSTRFEAMGRFLNLDIRRLPSVVVVVGGGGEIDPVHFQSYQRSSTRVVCRRDKAVKKTNKPRTDVVVHVKLNNPKKT